MAFRLLDIPAPAPLWLVRRVPQAIYGRPVRLAALTVGRFSSPPPILYRLLLACRVDTQRSVPPEPPGRLDARYSVSASWVSSGWTSATGEFSSGPAFWGGDQAWLELWRVDCQMSAPSPPGRVDQKRISLASARSVGAASLNAGAFTSATG